MDRFGPHKCWAGSFKKVSEGHRQQDADSTLAVRARAPDEEVSFNVFLSSPATPGDHYGVVSEGGAVSRRLKNRAPASNAAYLVE